MVPWKTNGVAEQCFPIGVVRESDVITKKISVKDTQFMNIAMVIFMKTNRGKINETYIFFWSKSVSFVFSLFHFDDLLNVSFLSDRKSIHIGSRVNPEKLWFDSIKISRLSVYCLIQRDFSIIFSEKKNH